MSMDHKAYIFDYAEFARLFADTLADALETGETRGILVFIAEHRALLTDPIEGEPIKDGWDRDFGPNDVQAYADVALTLFYDPSAVMGLSTGWMALNGILEATSGADPSWLLGDPFGPPEHLFDPGLMGSYFQSSDGVARNLRAMDAFIAREPSMAAALAAPRAMLRAAAERGRGLYVTF